METIEDVNKEVNALTARIAALTNKKRSEKMKSISDNLATVSAEMVHDQKSMLYVQFMESKQYVDNLKAEIKKSGHEAVNHASGIVSHLKLDPSGTKALTYDVFQAGSTVEITGRPYLVLDFKHSFSGSTVELLSLGKTVHILGEPVNPYSGIHSNWNHGTKTLTVARRDKLQKGQTLVIDGSYYEPINVYAESANCYKYELQAVA